MQIDNIQLNNRIYVDKSANHMSFGSKNCPIKPFLIQTSKGPLSVMEMQQSDFIKTINFYFDCCVDSINDWKKLKNCSDTHRKYYLGHIGRFLKRSENKPDGNTTILIAKDSANQVKALFDMQSFNESLVSNRKKFSDLKTGYVNDCLVDAEFRSQGVGAKMLNKLLKTADGHFTDVFLVAVNPQAAEFYKRLGFKHLDKSNIFISKLDEVFLSRWVDKRDLSSMVKPIDFQESWWKRLIPLIK